MNIYIPTDEESRFLLLKIVEQAVRDYLSLGASSAPIDREYYETACELLFSNEYTLDYGGKDLTLKDILEVLDIEIDWFRERVLKLKEIKNRQFIKHGAMVDEDEDF